MHISLTDKLDQYVREKVATGLYNNASEVVREALRRQIKAEEAEEARLEVLRREIAVGWDQLDAGHVADFDPDAVNRALDAEA